MKTKPIILDGFSRLHVLDNLTWTHYREEMLGKELESEKRHRRDHVKPYKASATIAAKYFVVKWILEALERKNRKLDPSDVLHCRPAWLDACGLVSLYRKQIRKALKGFDVEAFRAIDYSNEIA